MPQTLRLLITRPGEVTRAYNAGKRARFVTPLKLYLFASVVFFLVLSVLPGRHNAQFVKVAKPSATTLLLEPKPDTSFTISFSPAPGEVPVGVDDFDAWLKTEDNARLLPPFFVAHIRAMLKSPDGFLGSLIDATSKASMLLVPIYALFLKVLYVLRRPRLFYGEHLVFSLHLHSFVYLLNTLSVLLTLALTNRVSGILNAVLVSGARSTPSSPRGPRTDRGSMRSTLKMATAGVAYLIALVCVPHRRLRRRVLSELIRAELSGARSSTASRSRLSLELARFREAKNTTNGRETLV